MLSEATLQKLRLNPHYKMDSRPNGEDPKPPEAPEAKFDVLPIHNSDIPKHPTKFKKKGIIDKKNK